MNWSLSGAGEDFLVGGLKICGFALGDSVLTGGQIAVSDIPWLENGRAASCFSGAGTGSGRRVGDGDGAVRPWIGDDPDGRGSGGGELCFVGENDKR